ncbi:MAG: serine acetyltransferase [Spirochaetaceae bacterium]|jgi:serine O-acetyltransferase|nr:serine acetyltransferase [Spirochaetaceae bacterium]
MENVQDSRRRHIVESIVQSYTPVGAAVTGYQINRSVIHECIEKLREIIFPGYFGKKNMSAGFVEYHVGELLEDIEYNLTMQVERALRHRVLAGAQDPAHPHGQPEAGELVVNFLAKLPAIRALLLTDVDATFDGDPAAFSKDEIISSYPGIFAIMVFRLAHELYALDVPLIPRIMTERAHSITGIDIHPGACIGSSFFIDHGTGIVIGETTLIGTAVKIYQGVTLGGLSTKGGQSLKSTKRHPTIEDNVTIYAGASILGGGTVIGEGAVIGSNVFITQSVPRHTKVSIKNPDLQFRENGTAAASRRGLSQDSFWNDYSI